MAMNKINTLWLFHTFDRSVKREDILCHVQSGNILIVLVDWSQLECIWCDKLRCQVNIYRAANESLVLMGFDERENMTLLYANNNGADQHTHLCSLISTFVICCLESIRVTSLEKASYKPVSSATETSKKIEISPVTRLCMILSKSE